MFNTLEQLNKFLAENSTDRENEIIPGPPLQHAENEKRLKIYNQLSQDEKLVKMITNFGFSYGSKFNLNNDDVSAAVLAALVYLISIGRLELWPESEKNA